jgi:single-strand DNA-binding protein
LSRGLNKAEIIGHLGQDPEVRFTGSGTAVCNFTVATKHHVKGEDQTEWHRLVAFGKLAEIIKEYLHKGSMAYFEGRLQTRKWQDNDGNEKHSTEIIVNEMIMLGGKQGWKDPAAGENPARQPATDNNTGGDDGLDDIPFAPVDWRAS